MSSNQQTVSAIMQARQRAYERRRQSLLIVAIIAAPVLMAWLLDPRRETTAGMIPIGVLGLAVVLVVISPLIIFAVTGAVVRRIDAETDYLRLFRAQTDPSALTAGYLEAVQETLRPLWIAMQGIGLAAALAITYLMVSTLTSESFSFGMCGRGGRFGGGFGSCNFSVSTVDALIPAATSAMIGIACFVLSMAPVYMGAMYTSAYITLRWPDKARIIIAELMLSGIAIVLGVVYFFVTTGPAWWWLLLPAMLAFSMAWVFVVRWLIPALEKLIADRLASAGKGQTELV